MKRFALALPAIIAFLLCHAALADVLWDNRGTLGVGGGIDLANSTVPPGTAPGAIFTNADPMDPVNTAFSRVLEDGIFAGGAGPYTITGIRFGYENNTAGNVTVDALVNFFDTVDYTVADSSSILSGPVGPQYRFTFTAGTPAGETAVLPLTGGPLSFPDNSFGISVSFVNTGTSTPSTNVQYLFRNIPITVGASDEFFAFDEDNNGTYIGSEVRTWMGDPYPAANMYLEIDGTVVPEPAALGLLGVLGLIARRPRPDR